MSSLLRSFHRLARPASSELTAARDRSTIRRQMARSTPQRNRHSRVANRKVDPEPPRRLRVAWAQTLLHPVQLLLARRRTMQVLLSAALAVGLVALSHATNLRVHGQDGDAAVAIPAFLIGFPLSGWLLTQIQIAQLVPRFASLWLRVRAKNPSRAEGVATIVFTAIIGGFLKALNVTVPGAAADLVLAAVAFVVSYLVVAQITGPNGRDSRAAGLLNWSRRPRGGPEHNLRIC